MTFPGARTFLWRRNEDLFLLAAEWKSLWLQKVIWKGLNVETEGMIRRGKEETTAGKVYTLHQR